MLKSLFRGKNLSSASGHSAHHGITCDHHLAREITYNNLRPSIPIYVPDLVTELICKCWDTNPNKRPSSEEICDIISDMLSNESAEFATQLKRADGKALENLMVSDISAPSHFGTQITSANHSKHRYVDSDNCKSFINNLESAGLDTVTQLKRVDKLLENLMISDISTPSHSTYRYVGSDKQNHLSNNCIYY
ncbi:8029_t:CDS:2 [Dentiscutata erythropus]|uniref:8029_t:CDS:1 n=1 Tax=Dentiscutata erythropus TaxID=1348616 RepID=A0A9N9ER23_9GLOM|nr:8029_t:CDS:2 [Dentiscutata erythropus]